MTQVLGREGREGGGRREWERGKRRVGEGGGGGRGEWERGERGEGSEGENILIRQRI